jgi:hypothetical protein
MEAWEFEQKLRERLVTRWGCANPIGVQPEVLEESFKLLQRPIPDLYRCFLFTCGEFAGTLFFEYDWKVETQEARNHEMRLVCEEFNVRLPLNLCTFLDYLGDYFWCFNLSGNSDDPEVLMFDLTQP